jgi:quinol monooxygenase YgiN
MDPFITIAHYTTTSDQRHDFLNLLNSRAEILAQLGYMPAEPIQIFADAKDPNTFLEIITWVSEAALAEASARPEIQRIDNALRAMLASPGAMGVEFLRRG